MNEEEIFHQALARSLPEGRAAYLEQACAGIPAERATVEALLRANVGASEFLGRPASGLVATIEEPVSEHPGTVIGPYKLLQQIGEGGMGTVYMAEQTHPVQRKVALKLIKPGMDSRQVIARFEAERQALAIMDHVNIARVFDAGATDAGRPYFAMELVHGVPITKYCDDNRLTPRERLELFVPVCQAIQHAHQKGIIHRDVKPSNVMVTLYDGKPVPKVIDFGLAKATEQKLTERTLFTHYGAMVGTLEYMSPEQAEMSALGADTRTDIYSLGVLLYELLTGSTPLSHKRLKGAAFGEVLRMIREEVAPRPSTRLSESGKALASISAQRHMEPAKLTKLVRGELDWIVMKCLEKDRNRRYEAAKDFAADVQRYLNDETVLACSPSAGYRLRKFVRRNSRPVLAASLVVLALLAGIVGTTWGMIRAEQERWNALSAQYAEEERAEGERRAKEEAQTRLAQIEKGTEILASVFRDLDPNTAEKEGVTLRALLCKRLGEAAQQLEGEAVGDPLVVARLQHVLGISLHELGHLKQAEVVLLNACRTQERLLGADHLETVASKHDLAMLYRAQGKYALAEALYQEVLAVRTAKLGADHPDTLTTQQHLALEYHSQRKYALAETLSKEVLAIRTAKLGADHPDTLTSQHRLALLYRSQEKYALAETLCKGVLAVRTAKLGADNLDTVASKHLLAALYRAQRKYALAETLCKEVLAVRTAKLGADHPDTLTSQHHLALLYGSMKKLDLSIPLLEVTLKLRKAILDPDHPDTLGTQLDLGVNYCDAGRFADAIALLEEVHQKGPHPHMGTTRNALLTAYLRAGKTTEATALVTEAVQAARQWFPANSPELAADLAEVGQTLLETKAYAAAEPLLRESLSLGEQKVPDAWDTHNARSLLGGALLGQEKYADAEPLLLQGYAGMKERAVKIPPESGSWEQGRLTTAVERLAQLYDAWDKPDEAAKWRKDLEAHGKAAETVKPKDE
jgi:serine/threonine protein kinase